MGELLHSALGVYLTVSSSQYRNHGPKVSQFEDCLLITVDN